MLTTEFGLIDDEEDPGARVVLGVVELLGESHHAWAVEVTTDAQGCQVAVCDPHQRLADMATADAADGPYATVEIPGFTGRWVLWVTPWSA